MAIKKMTFEEVTSLFPTDDEIVSYFIKTGEILSMKEVHGEKSASVVCPYCKKTNERSGIENTYIFKDSILICDSCGHEFNLKPTNQTLVICNNYEYNGDKIAIIAICKSISNHIETLKYYIVNISKKIKYAYDKETKEPVKFNYNSELNKQLKYRYYYHSDIYYKIQDGSLFTIKDDTVELLLKSIKREGKTSKKMSKELQFFYDHKPEYPDINEILAQEKIIPLVLVEKDLINCSNDKYSYTCPFCKKKGIINAEYFTDEEKILSCGCKYGDYTTWEFTSDDDYTNIYKTFNIIYDTDDGYLAASNWTLRYKLTSDGCIQDASIKFNGVAFVSKEKIIGFLDEGKCDIKICRSINSISSILRSDLHNEINKSQKYKYIVFRDTLSDMCSAVDVKCYEKIQKYNNQNSNIRYWFRNYYGILDDKKPDFDYDADTVEGFFRLSKYNINLAKKSSFINYDIIKKIQDNEGNNVTKEDFVYFKSNPILHLAIRYYDLGIGITIHKLVQYLEHTRLYQCINPSETITYWYDYLKSAQKIGIDLSDNKAKYPVSLRKEHDIVCFKAALINDDKNETKFAEKVKDYQKFEYSSASYAMQVPQTIKDLFEEGRVLNHCAGSYADRIIKGETMLFFVRDLKDPTVPYFTLELLNDEIVQLRGKNNIIADTTNDKKLIMFVNSWAKKNGFKEFYHY